MNQKSAIALFFVICLTIVSLGAINSLQNHSVHAFSPQIIQQGAIGDDVIELQARLQYIGFYHGKIDGVFGWGSYWMLSNFQYEFGLPIDGVASEQTKNKLVAATEYDEQTVKNQMYQDNSYQHYGKQEGQQGDNQNQQTTETPP